MILYYKKNIIGLFLCIFLLGVFGILNAQVPHLVYGDLLYTSEANPTTASFDAYIIGRQSETLDENSLNCGYQNGIWQVQCGNFPTNWTTGDILHVDFDDGSGNTGSIEVTLTNESEDDAGITTLTDASDNVKLSMDDMSALRGETIEIPLRMTGLTVADSVLAFELEVGFDTDVLLAIEAVKEGTMTHQWEMVLAGPKADEMSVAGFTSNSSSTRLVPDDGILVKLKFITQGDPQSQTTESSLVRILSATIFTMDETIYVRNTKTGAVTLQSNANNTSKQIQILPGWNLISIGLTPENASLPAVLQGLDIDAVWALYGADVTFRTWQNNRPINRLTSMDGIHGYYVKSAESATETMQIDGLSIDVTIPIILYPNYNLIGYLPNAAYSVDEASQSLGDKVRYIWGYYGDQTGFKSWKRDRPVNALTALEPGYGYWFDLDTTGTLSYPQNGTPVSKIIGISKATSANSNDNMPPANCDFWAHQSDTFSPGDIIEVYDPQNVLCGADTVKTTEGMFIISARSDDPETTDIDEGAVEGDTLHFKVNGNDAVVIGTSNSFGDEIIIGNNAVFSSFNSYKVRLTINSDSHVLPDNQENYFNLYKNYPNPFNPSTTIPFSIEKPVPVKLEIYDVNGNLVNIIYQGNLDSGHYTMQWNSKNIENTKVPSGVYFIRLIADRMVLTQKCLLIR